MRRWAAAGLVALAVLAGCGGLPPEEGAVGVQNGIEPNDSLRLTTDDGLNATERELVKHRAMARIESVRGLAFTEDVPVTVITREQYRANRSGPNRSHRLWNNQVWEGLFLVGEDRDVAAVFNSTLGSSVLGYYDPAEDRIVVVSDSETPRLRRSTLVHELVHALQDQRFGLDERRSTQDRQLAVSGVVEGEAVDLTRLYQQRCGAEWACVSLPRGGDGDSGGGTRDAGVFTVIAQPYQSGPGLIRSVRERDGWGAVDDLHADYPASTEQVIHPDRYPDERPVNVTVADNSGGEWRRFDHDPVADTVGEASIYAMFTTNGVGDPEGGYVHPAADGWAGDALVPYRNGDRYGYVWTTRWDTATDAREFHEAYRALLDGVGARQQAAGVYEVPDGAYADAFRVVRDGRTVRVVNAPTVDALRDVHRPG